MLSRLLRSRNFRYTGMFLCALTVYSLTAIFTDERKSQPILAGTLAQSHRRLLLGDDSSQSWVLILRIGGIRPES